MRYLISISLFLFLLPFTANTQDIITKKNGKKIECIVFDETPEAVRYRKYSEPNGPLFKVSKNNVYKILYEKDDTLRQKQKMIQESLPLTITKNFWGIQILQGKKKLNNLEVKELIKRYPDAFSEFSKGKTINTFAGIISFASGFMLGWELGRYTAVREVNGVNLAIGGLGLVTSIMMNVAGTAKIKKSVEIYNQAIEKPAEVSLNFGLMKNGIGLCLRF